MMYRFADQTDLVLSCTPCPNSFVPIGQRIWTWERAAGGCICEICGKPYYDHPPEMDKQFTADHGYSRRVPHLNILCNGERVKL